jgi:orotate phosphoribosyltransferase
VNDVLNHFREAGALLDGHFVLSSGLHSPQYLQCALALKGPDDAARFGQAIAEQFNGKAIDTVASPAIGGIIIGFAVAQAFERTVHLDRTREWVDDAAAWIFGRSGSKGVGCRGRHNNWGLDT